MIPLPTPSLTSAQSYSAGLWRLVSHPSYHAPVCTKTPGLWIGGPGVSRFDAAAKYSSLQARIVEFKLEDARLVVLEKHLSISSRGTGLTLVGMVDYTNITIQDDIDTTFRYFDYIIQSFQIAPRISCSTYLSTEDETAYPVRFWWNIEFISEVAVWGRSSIKHLG